jgi:RNA polymerase sigma-70 factor (ECF subfamily)
VRELPEQQRFAIVLHYVEDRSVADIAEVLQCSEGTVKTHLSRGRAALARGLTSAGTEVGHD